MSSVTTDAELREIAEIVARSSGIGNYELSPPHANVRSQGFTSEIVIFAISPESKTQQQLNVLLKRAFKHKAARKLLKLRLLFENEIYFYTTICQEFEKFRITAGYPKEYKLVPICHQTSIEERNEFLVLENLKEQGYVTVHIDLDFTYNHMKLVFQVFGYFHAQSLAYKAKKPEEFAELVQKILPANTLMLEIAQLTDTIMWLAHEIICLLIPGKDDVLIDKFKKYIKNPAKLLLQSMDSTGKFTVLMHGDSWCNNFFFKYNGNGTPVDMCLIDWQIMNIGSPVCDLSYALYSEGSKANLDNFQDYLGIYYDSLSSTLRNYGCDPTTTFPYVELERQWKIHAKYGFIFGTMMVRTMCTKSKNHVNLNIQKYVTKIRDIIDHMHILDAL